MTKNSRIPARLHGTKTLDRIEKLERKLLSIDRVSEVEFDLDGFLDNILQVIILVKYDIPPKTEGYFDVRKEVLLNVLKITNEFDLWNSGDRIEDYGEHWYIVRDCGASWRD